MEPPCLGNFKLKFTLGCVNPICDYQYSDFKHLLNWLNLGIGVRVSHRLSWLCKYLYLPQPLCNCCHFYCPGNVFCPLTRRTRPSRKKFLPCLPSSPYLPLSHFFILYLPHLLCGSGCPLYLAKQKFRR